MSYTRNREPQTVYVLVGSVVISTKDNVASAFNTPSITVTSSSGNMYRVPEEAIQCPSLVVPAGGQVTCTFAAGYIGRQPLPGSMSASISLAGTLIPIQLEAVPVTYDFTNAETLNTGAFATASSYFEMGSGIIQPYGVFGEQPPPGLRLEDSRVFRFIAVFGGVTASSVCGRTWKVGTQAARPLGAAGGACLRGWLAVKVSDVTVEVMANLLISPVWLSHLWWVKPHQTARLSKLSTAV